MELSEQKEQEPQLRTHLSEVPSLTISLERQRFGMSTSEEPMGSLTSCLGQQVNRARAPLAHYLDHAFGEAS
jgi:hypothetical protein